MVTLKELEKIREQLISLPQDRKTQKKINVLRQLLKAEEHLSGKYPQKAALVREERKKLEKELGIAPITAGGNVPVCLECGYKHLLSAEGELMEAQTAPTPPDIKKTNDVGCDVCEHISEKIGPIKPLSPISKKLVEKKSTVRKSYTGMGELMDMSLLRPSKMLREITREAINNTIRDMPSLLSRQAFSRLFQKSKYETNSVL